jgi:putative intracellular protease/amidase
LKRIAVVLFDGFETLDAAGPIEVFGQVQAEQIETECCSLYGGLIRSSQGFEVSTSCFKKAAGADAVLVPGGMGTRALALDAQYVAALKEFVEPAAYILTVCTGSALLARTGLLDGRQATSNKMAFSWAVSQGPDVDWQCRTRWAKDGRFYTSSGVSAGIDMALAFVADVFGNDAAEETARRIEYCWNNDSKNDPFAV